MEHLSKIFRSKNHKILFMVLCRRLLRVGSSRTCLFLFPESSSLLVSAAGSFTGSKLGELSANLTRPRETWFSVSVCETKATGAPTTTSHVLELIAVL